MLIRIRHLPFLLVGLIIIGIVLGFRLEPWVGWRAKKPQVLLTGSGNVHPFLKQNVPNSLWSRIDSVWLDEGSGDAQTIAFSVFNFGRSVSVDTKNRVGFIAMSSNGTKRLANIFADPNTESDRKVRNWFLSIVIAKQPLVILHRGLTSGELRLQNGDRLPPELGSVETPFKYVQISDLKDMVENPTPVDFVRYFPGANSGTKALFESAANDKSIWGDKVTWADGDKIREVPDYIEDLGDTSFIELVSEPQEPHKDDSMNPCKRLRKHQIDAAIVCTGSGSCEHAVPANYVLIFKVEQVTGTDPYEFRIPNASECSIAQVFASNIRPDCLIDPRGVLKDGNMLTLDVPKPGLPEYLKCF